MSIIAESTRFTAQALIRYAHLKVECKPLIDKVSGEFERMIKTREGCPLKEKDLERQLRQSICVVSRQLNKSKKERLELSHEARFLKAFELSLILEALLQEDK